MKTEVITLSEKNNATLTCYILGVKGKFVFSKRPAVVIIPGGSYQYCSDREADPVAFAFMKAGYHAFILRYSCRDVCSWPRPLEDYEQAMEIIKENAESYGVDINRIVTIGFSAGGHLAACTATMAKNKPAASILVYPAIDRDLIDFCMPGLPEPSKFVDVDTCPCFLIAARNDNVVDVKNLVHFELALIENCIPYESHIYSYGGHGFSIVEDLNTAAQTSERLPHWVDEALGWLEEVLGKQTTTGYTSPNPNVAKNGDSREYLSIDCSLRHALKQQEDVVAIVNSIIDSIASVVKCENRQSIIEAFGSLTIRQILESSDGSKDFVEGLDKKLNTYKNIK